MASNGLPEQLEQKNIRNDDIQSLIGSIDISAYANKLTPILADPATKELLIKELKENQPITGGLLLSRIIQKIKLIIEKPEVNLTSTEVNLTSTEVNLTSTEVNSKKNKANTTDIKNDTTDIKALIEDTGFRARMELAQTATTDVNRAFSSIAGSIGGELRSKISGEIDGKLQDIKDGKIPEETRSFLNSIGANTPESIVSPEIQSILTAHISTQIYLNNQSSILENSPPALRKTLEDGFNILEVNAPTLGVPRSTTAPGVAKLLGDIPKSDREAIKSTVNSLTQGSPDTLVTRTGDRLTFSDPRNERYNYEIDMSKQPPRLAKTLNGLSISRDVVGLSPEQREKKAAYETAKGKLDKGEQKYSQGINEFWGARRGEYTLTGTSVEKGEDGKTTKKDINIYSSIFLSENRWKQNQYEMIEQEIATGNLISENRGGKLETMIQLTRDMKSTNLSQMLDTGETENHSKINTMLEQRYEKITQLQKANQEIVEAKTEVSKNPQNTENQYNNFDGTARDNLSWLVDNRFDRMGPNANDALQKIIDSINIDEPSSTIDLIKPMNQQDHKRLIKKLEKLGGTPDVLTNGDKLPVFQQRITMAASKNLADPNSIRGLLTKVETPSSTK